MAKPGFTLAHVSMKSSTPGTRAVLRLTSFFIARLQVAILPLGMWPAPTWHRRRQLHRPGTTPSPLGTALPRMRLRAVWRRTNGLHPRWSRSFSGQSRDTNRSRRTRCPRSTYRVRCHPVSPFDVPCSLLPHGADICHIRAMCLRLSGWHRRASSANCESMGRAPLPRAGIPWASSARNLIRQISTCILGWPRLRKRELAKSILFFSRSVRHPLFPGLHMCPSAGPLGLQIHHPPTLDGIPVVRAALPDHDGVAFRAVGLEARDIILTRNPGATFEADAKLSTTHATLFIARHDCLLSVRVTAAVRSHPKARPMLPERVDSLDR